MSDCGLELTLEYDWHLMGDAWVNRQLLRCLNRNYELGRIESMSSYPDYFLMNYLAWKNRRTFIGRGRPMRLLYNAIIMTIGEISSGKPVEAVGELIDLLENLRTR